MGDEDVQDAARAVLINIREQKTFGSQAASWRGCGNSGGGERATVLACGTLTAGVSSTYRYAVMGGEDVVGDEKQEVSM